MGLFDFIRKKDSIQQETRPTAESKSITSEDMKPFENTGFRFSTPIFVYDRKNIMLLEGDNIRNAEKVMHFLNDYLLKAKKLAGITDNLYINLSEIEFIPQLMNAGKKDEHVQYYSFLECCPYTKTGKIAKYPVVFHYADKYLAEYDPKRLCFGELYFLQSGEVGKAEMVFNLKKVQIKVWLELKEGELKVKKVVKADFSKSKEDILYQS